MVALAAAVCWSASSSRAAGRNGDRAGVVLLFGPGPPRSAGSSLRGHRPTRLPVGWTALAGTRGVAVRTRSTASASRRSRPRLASRSTARWTPERLAHGAAHGDGRARVRRRPALHRVARRRGPAVLGSRGATRCSGSRSSRRHCLFVHSLSYGVFFEDPLVWAVLGVATAAWSRPAPVPREARGADARGRAVAAAGEAAAARGRQGREPAARGASGSCSPRSARSCSWQCRVRRRAVGVPARARGPTGRSPGWSGRRRRVEVTALRAAGLLAGCSSRWPPSSFRCELWPRWAAVALTCVVVCLLACRRSSSRRGFVSRARRGSSRTTRRIRSSSPATSSATARTRTATTTRTRGSSASTRSTGA